MNELIIEEDFHELPEEPHHKWLVLEMAASQRLQVALSDCTEEVSGRLMHQYMHIVHELAESFGVEGIAISNEARTQTSYDKFQLSVSRARSRIWASSTPTFPFGRIVLSDSTKAAILTLTTEIEIHIESLNVSDRRRKALFNRLEDFRREISQPRTRVGTALTSLAQISTVVAMTTTTFAQLPSAYSTIQALIGAEQAAVATPELCLLDNEKQLLLAPPPKQIEGPKTPK